MLFNSFEFALFLPVAYAVYRLLHRWRLPWLAWLLLTSAIFYGFWNPWYLILLACSTFLSYFVGKALASTEAPGARKALLIAGVTGDLLLLSVFKYGNFILENLEFLLASVGYPTRLPRVAAELPAGISFYTFQTLSYTIDLYRRRIDPAKSLLEFSVFVIFFPQLVAGPIVRAAEFLPQMAARPRLDRAAIGQGVFLILAGLAKKMMLADILYTFLVKPYFASPYDRNAWETVLALWAANFQVYCDFSGYSDVAIGAALLFGFVLPVNFNRPFWSRTPMEHWRRWHISLSTWLRDYLYIPLGGSQKGPSRAHVNTVITFFLGGIWHGAGWTFAIWGLYNGLILVVWRKIAPRPAKSWPGIALEIFATFNAICFGLIFLHAASFADAWAILGSLARPTGPMADGLPREGLLALAAAIALHATPQGWKERMKQAFAEAPAWALGLAVALAGGVLSVFAGFASPFFYFQF